MLIYLTVVLYQIIENNLYGHTGTGLMANVPEWVVWVEAFTATFLGKTLYYELQCLPPDQVHKWVLANLMLGKQHTLRNSIPHSGGGERKYCFMLWKQSATLKNNLAWMQISYPDLWCWSSAHYPIGDWACPDLSALLTLIVQHVWDQIPLCNLCSSCSWSVMYWLSERRSVMYSLDGTKTYSDSVSLVQNTDEPLINGHSRKWDVSHLLGISHLLGVYFWTLLFLSENGIMLRQS